MNAPATTSTSATKAGSTPGLTERASPRLRLAITRTARRMRQEANPELGPTLSALASIDRHGPLDAERVAKAEHIQRRPRRACSPASATRAWSPRAADPSDGRCSIVSATPAGVAMLKRLRGRKNAYLARRMRDLPDDDVAALERAAEILERVLEEDRL